MAKVQIISDVNKKSLKIGSIDLPVNELSNVILHATVGRPRESNTWMAFIDVIFDINFRKYLNLLDFLWIHLDA